MNRTGFLALLGLVGLASIVFAVGTRGQARPTLGREGRRAETAWVCPRCSGSNIVPIAYGLPGPGMYESARRGEIALGGCLIAPGMPVRFCKDCRERFGVLSGKIPRIPPREV